ncbi:phosphoheptose isomerase [Paractinoplanes deccanensis]|uniref:Phosphoheptose isomerase n=1 Tax=Paractinoplanes deccanensis TaxID=113561 RepID=A0ABQ3YE29_9ACTN|nr:SIS domain-containing protein [Actinoplanes deccanensis]GID78254.1 phosphoheptose isomerase [Actinoplanes deccanensis]
MTYTTVLRDRIGESAETKTRLTRDDELMDVLDGITATVVECVASGRTVFFCGNGGSSTDAEHLSAELLGRFRYDRPSMSSYCLASNTAAMTAIGNDYSYDLTFARQLAGLGRKGDVLIGLSTSGNSANVVQAVIQAADMEITTVAFTGADGGKLAGLADHTFRAPSSETARVQECHMAVGHTICEIVEAAVHPRP